MISSPEATVTRVDSDTVERTIRYPNGRKEVLYTVRGRLHRADGPTKLSYRSNGSLFLEEWYFHGNHHREDAPAYIEYYPNGMIKREVWYAHGVSQRGNKPACTEYDEYGKLLCEDYRLNGVLHRLDGPACIYYEAGRIKHENWVNHGVRHREDGAAAIHCIKVYRRHTRHKISSSHRKYTSLYRRYLREGRIPRNEYRWNYSEEFYLHDVEVTEDDLDKYKKDPVPILIRCLKVSKNYERIIPLIEIHDPRLAKSLLATQNLL